MGVDEAENARVGYEVAASLVAYEGNLIWTRFGAMMVAHTLVVAAIGVIADSPDAVAKVSRIGLELAGIVLCAIWLLLNRRGFDYFAYWLLSMRELEEEHLAPVKTISRGAAFAAGEPVDLLVGGSVVRRRVGPLGWVRVAVATDTLIGVFTMLYLVLLVLSLADLVS